MATPEARIIRLPTISDADALFLDFDGTLTELAPRPDAVQTATGLVDSLAALSTTLGGALAIVSGRPVDDLDRFLAPLRPALAAEHGAVLRLADGQLRCAQPPDLREVVHAASALAAARAGVVVERKTTSVALHYRAAPHDAQRCIDTMATAIAGRPELELLHGKCVVEVRRAGVDKGRAIAELMTVAPFAGRRPIFAGDDVTDESGFAYVQRAGGVAIKVGDGDTQARHVCESPQALRAWLASSVALPAAGR